jgi:hypothetical protein
MEKNGIYSASLNLNCPSGPSAILGWEDVCVTGILNQCVSVPLRPEFFTTSTQPLCRRRPGIGEKWKSEIDVGFQLMP